MRSFQVLSKARYPPSSLRSLGWTQLQPRRGRALTAYAGAVAWRSARSTSGLSISTAATALKSENLTGKEVPHAPSFAFSGCGWLVPFFFGVIEEMRSSGHMHNNTLVSGTSGGAIAATVAASGIDAMYALEHFIELAKLKRDDSTAAATGDIEAKFDMDTLLKMEVRGLLRAHLCDSNAVGPGPSGSGSRLLGGEGEVEGEFPRETEQRFLRRINLHENLHICVSRIRKGGSSGNSARQSGTKEGEGGKVRVLPSAETVVVSKYASIDSVVQAVAASSYIPVYSNMDLRGAQILDEVSMANFTHLLRALNVAGESIWRKRSLFTQMTLPLALAEGVEEDVAVVDGGVTALMPPTGDIPCGPMSHHVAPFLYEPRAPYRQPVIAVGVPPNSDMQTGAEPPMKASLFQLVLWAAKPPEEAVLRALFEEGRRSSREYARTHLGEGRDNNGEGKA